MQVEESIEGAKGWMGEEERWQKMRTWGEEKTSMSTLADEILRLEQVKEGKRRVRENKKTGV